MSCKTPGFDAANDEGRCKCRSAVMRTYKAMKKDEPETIALEAAIRVYRHHHPEDCIETAHLTVERWVCQTGGRFH